jgi:hypothetical protein
MSKLSYFRNVLTQNPNRQTLFRSIFSSSLKNENLLKKKTKRFPVISTKEFLQHSDDPTSTVHLNNQNRHKQVLTSQHGILTEGSLQLTP